MLFLLGNPEMTRHSRSGGRGVRTLTSRGGCHRPWVSQRIASCTRRFSTPTHLLSLEKGRHRASATPYWATSRHTFTLLSGGNTLLEFPWHGSRLMHRRHVLPFHRLHQTLATALLTSMCRMRDAEMSTGCTRKRSESRAKGYPFTSWTARTSCTQCAVGLGSVVGHLPIWVCRRKCITRRKPSTALKCRSPRGDRSMGVLQHLQLCVPTTDP